MSNSSLSVIYEKEGNTRIKDMATQDEFTHDKHFDIQLMALGVILWKLSVFFHNIAAVTGHDKISPKTFAG